MSTKDQLTKKLEARIVLNRNLRDYCSQKVVKIEIASRGFLSRSILDQQIAALRKVA